MVDVFEEVEEQLRSDRYRALLRKALPWIVGGVVAILLGVAGYTGWQKLQENARAKSSEAYQAAVEALQQGDKAKAFSSFESISKTGTPVYKSLALMNLGGMRLQDGETDEAVKFFDQAAQAAPDPIVGDLARLKSAYALLDTAPYKDVEARLMPLTEEKRPYRIFAKEALGYARLLAGDTKAARRDFVALQTMLDVPPNVAQNASLAVDLIDSGSAKTIPGIVKAAVALPPPVQGNPADLQLSPQGQ